VLETRAVGQGSDQPPLTEAGHRSTILAMMMRFSVLALIALLGTAPPSAAQTAGVEMPATRDRERLDRLFERLQAAPTADAARAVAQQIEQRFEKSGSDTADLLLQRAKQAIESRNYDLALDLLDFVMTLKPNWSEAYHRRAIVHFLLKDEESAMRDIRQSLSHEPRHFHALAGLGQLLQMMGKRKQAYQVYRRAQDVYPLFPDLEKMLERLKLEAEGQPI
jgi:tetratricopeptide (TPR) repeat protein